MIRQNESNQKSSSSSSSRSTRHESRSMVSLNEKRSKIRYVVQNKTEWTEDGNKFGKKMLEKMGWKQGDGLGKNQDGRTEHLDVKLKTNSKGLGFIRGKYDSTWIEHSNSFDQVLQQLQLSHSTSTLTSTSTSKDISNLRENLQQTKTRFNYKKQSSGKDLSCRSQDELDCLFGSINQKKQIQNEEKRNDDDDQQEDKDEQTNEDQVYTTSKQSIEEYFKEKYRSKLLKNNSMTNQSIEKNEKQLRIEKKRKSPCRSSSSSDDEQSTIKSDPNEIFIGSNLNELNGYDGWKIKSSIEELKRNKDKSRKKLKKSSV